MSQVYAFHKTVRGHFHVMKEIPCEDSSESYSAEDGRYYIAAIADGHGSKSCFRSDHGSKTAVEVALKCLQQFADTVLASEEEEEEFYQEIFTDSRYCQTTVKRLTDTIAAEWYDCVLSHYAENPPALEEMGEGAAEYAGGKNTAHIYGTTLIAALQMPKCLMLFHQGDGRCDVFYEDGSVEQPIPWDSRCEDTATTSLCDEDVASSFRSQILNLTERPVMACYLGSDGVEDAYRDTYEGLGGSHIHMGGVHTFYKDLTCQLVEKGQEEFEQYLEPMLSGFSADGRFSGSGSGSGDDVSVAGIVDIDAVQKFTGQFQNEVKQYALEEELFWKKDELRGKTRKHGILQKRMAEALAALEEAQQKQLHYDEKIETIEGEKKENQNRIRELNEKYIKARAAFDEYDEKYQAIDAERIRIEEEIASLSKLQPYP